MHHFLSIVQFIGAPPVPYSSIPELGEAEIGGEVDIRAFFKKPIVSTTVKPPEKRDTPPAMDKMDDFKRHMLKEPGNLN